MAYPSARSILLATVSPMADAAFGGDPPLPPATTPGPVAEDAFEKKLHHENLPRRASVGLSLEIRRVGR